MRKFAIPATTVTLLLSLIGWNPPTADAFCGFYVAKADANLYNKASQVAIVRDGERTVLTMANDYEGDLEQFAMVVPVPEVLKRDQIHIGERRLLERLDAFTAPRIVEYFDPDPCLEVRRRKFMRFEAVEDAAAPTAGGVGRAQALGVRIEARYTVGEYDIAILSAEQSNGLETYLREQGYRLPRGAHRALAPYIKQGLKFFVAKVNLGEQRATGLRHLRPLQMAYASKRFMLPIRLGMLNAKDTQDLIIYTLTRHGRVETTNYRTVKIPSDQELPTFVKSEFAHFYRSMFARAWKNQGRNAVFMEYFWDMGWCDPCAATPLTRDELNGLGVFWLDGRSGAAQNAVVTRLHVRYDDDSFPEDLMFQQTRDRQNFQGRYIVRHPNRGRSDCAAREGYERQLRDRQNQRAETLAKLTGWRLDDIEDKMIDPSRPRLASDGEPSDGDSSPRDSSAADSWWQRLWK